MISRGYNLKSITRKKKKDKAESRKQKAFQTFQKFASNDIVNEAIFIVV